MEIVKIKDQNTENEIFLAFGEALYLCDYNVEDSLIDLEQRDYFETQKDKDNFQPLYNNWIAGNLGVEVDIFSEEKDGFERKVISKDKKGKLVISDV